MADRPILFSGPMVQALLAGSKSQTRRTLANHRVEEGIPSEIAEDRELRNWLVFERGDQICAAKVPYDIGDRLWVREAWRTSLAADRQAPATLETPGNGCGWPLWFSADGGSVTWRAVQSGGPGFVEPGRQRPGIFMPRWASRLTLTVTDVRAERLQDISESDALAEGVTGRPGENGGVYTAAYEAYAELWDHLNAARGYGWNANPWVVAITFDVRRDNIDAVPEEDEA